MRLVCLAEVCEFILDGTHGSPERTPNGVPVLSAQNVAGGNLALETDRFTTTDEYKAFAKRLKLESGDVLLTIVGTIGRAAVVDRVVPLVFQRSVAILRPKTGILDSRFFYHLTQHQQFQASLLKATNQSSQAGVYLGKLKRIQVTVPPLDAQRRIATILDHADTLRAKRRAAVAKLDSLAQSIFLSMFGDPATNPRGWKPGTLGDVIGLATDGPHVSPTYVESGIPFLSTRNIRPGKIVWDDLKFISREDAIQQWRKCKPEKGDILYTKGGTTGIAKVVDFDSEIAIWVHIALLKTNHDLVEPLWLEYMLNSRFCYAQSQRLTHGIGNQDLGLARMTRITLYIPPIEVQRKFLRVAESIGRLKINQTNAAAKTDALLASLQHRAFQESSSP